MCIHTARMSMASTPQDAGTEIIELRLQSRRAVLQLADWLANSPAARGFAPLVRSIVLEIGFGQPASPNPFNIPSSHLGDIRSVGQHPIMVPNIELAATLLGREHDNDLVLYLMTLPENEWRPSTFQSNERNPLHDFLYQELKQSLFSDTKESTPEILLGALHAYLQLAAWQGTVTGVTNDAELQTSFIKILEHLPQVERLHTSGEIYETCICLPKNKLERIGTKDEDHSGGTSKEPETRSSPGIEAAELGGDSSNLRLLPKLESLSITRPLRDMLLQGQTYPCNLRVLCLRNYEFEPLGSLYNFCNTLSNLRNLDELTLSLFWSAGSTGTCIFSLEVDPTDSIKPLSSVRKLSLHDCVLPEHCQTYLPTIFPSLEEYCELGRVLFYISDITGHAKSGCSAVESATRYMRLSPFEPHLQMDEGGGADEDIVIHKQWQYSSKPGGRNQRDNVTQEVWSWTEWRSNLRSRNCHSAWGIEEPTTAESETEYSDMDDPDMMDIGSDVKEC